MGGTQENHGAVHSPFRTGLYRLPDRRQGVYRNGMDRMAEQQTHPVLHPYPAELLDCEAFHQQADTCMVALQ